MAREVISSLCEQDPCCPPHLLLALSSVRHCISSTPACIRIRGWIVPDWSYLGRTQLSQISPPGLHEMDSR